MTRLRIQVAAVLALIAVGAAPVLALDAKPEQFDQMLKAYDPAAVEAARGYARTFDLKGMMEKSVPALRQSMVAQLKAKNQALNDEQINSFFDAFMQSAFVDSAPLIEQATILIMLQVLNRDEIIALNNFYSSPVGHSILTKMPMFMGRMPELMSMMQTYVIPRALEDAQMKMKKAGVDVRI